MFRLERKYKETNCKYSYGPVQDNIYGEPNPRLSKLKKGSAEYKSESEALNKDTCPAPDCKDPHNEPSIINNKKGISRS